MSLPNCFDKKRIFISKTLDYIIIIITLQYASLSVGCQQSTNTADVCCPWHFMRTSNSSPLTPSILAHNCLVTKVRMRQLWRRAPHLSRYPLTFRPFATTLSQLKICDFSGENFSRFWSAIIFYECYDDTTALQRRVLQTPLWHYTCWKVHLQTFLSIPIAQKCEILSCDSLVPNDRYVCIIININ